MKLKLISWNVNGIRAVINKEFIKSIKELKGDIVCLQEIKAKKEQVELNMKLLGYNYEYWNSAQRLGYSGTLVFSKMKPINVSFGMPEEDNSEGRIITVHFENFYLVNVYTPNSKRKLERLDYRKTWDANFLKYVKNLEKSKPVIFCGDLNVAHKEIDLKNPQTNKTTKTRPGNAGFTDSERESFDNIINQNFIDTFRFFHPNEEKYSWWSYMFSARIRNIGWRIDYFCVSNSLKDKLIDAQIHNDILGSDHCPISLSINL